MTEAAIEKKVKKIDDVLSRMERGQYVGVPISYITDQIAWLWRWRKIGRKEMVRLTDRATYVISSYGSDYYY